LATRLLAALIALLVWPGATTASEFALDRLDGSHVVVIRHANAPGTGDPAGFSLGDCATQRNLDETVRAQARRLGERFREAGIAEARVYSSQWCRCLETARLLGLGPVKELAALNSFFGRPADREPNLAALRDFLAKLDPGGDTPVVLVTHFVTISAITGDGVSSGEARVLRLNGTADPEVVGTIPAG